MIKTTLALLIPFIGLTAKANDDVNTTKQKIIQLASQHKGQGDPDFLIQNSLEPLVKQLLELSPQPPVVERLPLLHGVWKQVWGPYDYRNDDRGVDPELGVNEIYQYIFPDGYYYNVSPLYKNGNLEKIRIGLLRGKYKLESSNPNALKVRFTKYPGYKGRPKGMNIWDLAPLAETKQLPKDKKTTIVPTIIVRLFFGGGYLNEVYTDEDLRITYGDNNKYFKTPYLYIMTKVK